VEKANKTGFDTNSAEFVKSEGRVILKDGMESTSEVSFELKDSKGHGLRLRIDDGLKVDGKWFFTDRPMPDPVVVKNGKLEFLYIGAK
jgi:hypothetical protein